jgi:hypothetical protein
MKRSRSPDAARRIVFTSWCLCAFVRQSSHITLLQGLQNNKSSFPCILHSIFTIELADIERDEHYKCSLQVKRDIRSHAAGLKDSFCKAVHITLLQGLQNNKSFFPCILHSIFSDSCFSESWTREIYVWFSTISYVCSFRVLTLVWYSWHCLHK